MRPTAMLISLVFSASALAQDSGQRPMLSEACRAEVQQLCPAGGDRGARRQCLMTNRDKLSGGCKAEILQRMQAARAMGRNGESAAAPAAAPDSASAATATEYSYGSDPLQKLDFHTAPDSAKAPLLIFVHGGGWTRGDKGNTTGGSLAPHYGAQGYAVASINYRLVPQATVEQQAADVAQAVAWLRSNAARLGVDPDRIVLMGHSAGAHLVALVGTDPQYLRAAGLGLDALRGVIPNDGAAYDVPAQMKDGPAVMQQTYAKVFGADPARQKALSPTLQAVAPNAPAFLLIHVQRPDGVRQANALADALKRAGTRVQINGFPGEGLQGHMQINRELGDPAYPATPVVDAWLKAVFAS